MFDQFISAQRFHFIGIGGSGMSGLARIMVAQGKKVTGSDQQLSPTVLALEHEGITLKVGHDVANLHDDLEVVIYSPAVPETNVERQEARKKGLPEFSYPEAVGFLTQKYKTIAICGTHGKTTTTALASLALIVAKQDPTVIVGAALKEFDGRNERLGKGEYFILESCEYRRGFLNYHPQIIIITNIEVDHLDYYKDLEDYKKAFSEFVALLPKNGLVIANMDDANVRAVCEKLPKGMVRWFGRNEKADYQLKDYKFNLQIPGEHNLMNALAVVVLGMELKLDQQKNLLALAQYQGAARRFEQKGRIGKTIFIDDYGHHPTEIKATLKAVREKFGSDKKILCVFQPHQYSRTAKLLAGFAQAFNDVDEVIIPNILAVRDSAEDLKSVNEDILVQHIAEFQLQVSNGHGMAKTTEYLRKRLSDFDVIITMGAGDVYKIADEILKSNF